MEDKPVGRIKKCHVEGLMIRSLVVGLHRSTGGPHAAAILGLCCGINIAKGTRLEVRYLTLIIKDVPNKVLPSLPIIYL